MEWIPVSLPPIDLYNNICNQVVENGICQDRFFNLYDQYNYFLLIISSENKLKTSVFSVHEHIILFDDI